MSSKAIDDLPSDFLEEITAAQVEANQGWKPENTELIDTRIFDCPECDGPGMNTCYGYIAYACGAELVVGDDHLSEPCMAATANL